MQKSRILTCLMAAMAFALASFLSAAAVLAVVYCRDMKPVLLYAPEEAEQCVEELMDAVCAGDFSRAEALLFEQTELGLNRKPSDPVGAMIWDAYVESLDYALAGEIYATDSGLAQDVKLISLELPTVTEHLGSRAQALLDEAISSAEDVSQLYDEKNEYREDLVLEILQEAARQALEEDTRYTYQMVTIRLVYSNSRWRAVADRAFLDAVSGGIAG